MGCGSGMTCWRRLRDWQKAGAWRTIHHILLDKLRGAGLIDFGRALVDSGTVRAFGGAKKQAPAPWIGENPAPSIIF